MRLWIGIHLHQLSLNVLRPLWSADALPAALAVLENDCVVVLTAAASRMGVQPGMRRSSARAIAPGVVLTERDGAREQQALQATAVAMLQYTPEVALAEECVVLLDVGASLNAFGGARALCRRVRHTVRALGFAARVAMAPTARGAWLLARQPASRRRVLTMPALARHLDALPCVLLPAAREHRHWLQDIGCRTLGGLARLPRSGLQRRTSPQLLEMLDQAYGRAPELYDWVSPPATFNQRLEMPERTEHTDAAWFAAQHLVEQMCGWLRARHQAVSCLAFWLEHERGRHAMPPTELLLRLAEPAWQAEHLLRLLKERLARVVLPAPFLAIRLQAVEMAALSVPTDTLFADPAGELSGHRKLLELLSARLGREQVLQPAPVDDYRPEVANAWQPALAAGEPQRGQTVSRTAGRQELEPKRPATGARAAASDYPFWLLEQPLALAVRAERPVVNGAALRLVRGPERIETGWWNGHLSARDYFIAEDSQGARYWLYRERGTVSVHWFLHGMFA